MKPLLLIIMDGWGYSEVREHNGIAQANTPFFDSIFENYPHTLIDASGPAVGLPQGIMGNSEVGHMNLGSGRIIYTGLSQVYQAIDQGSFFKNEAFLDLIKKIKEKKSALHLMGLLSDGAVHSHQDHLYALLKLAKQEGLEKVFIHAFTDGRDTPPQDGIKYISQLEDKISEIGVGKIASVSGRFYAMDRDKRWDRVQSAYEAMTEVSFPGENSASKIVQKSYEDGKGDEFIIPKVVLDESGKSLGSVKDDDGIIFFNFRADRAREITQALTQENFDGFERNTFSKLSGFVCMAPYSEEFNLPVAFYPNYPEQTLGEVLSQNQLKQLRISETEKYAHVTYFFNGGREYDIEGEDKVLIPSDRSIATYDLKPEMSAPEVTERILQELDQGKYDVIMVNYANSDMVGHTAVPEAIIKAVETVDDCLNQVVSKVRELGGSCLVTADHGNSEQMVDKNGKPHTAHTTNLVPFILVNDKFKNIKLLPEGGRLCDVAPTILELLNLEKPNVMTGQSLILSY